MHSARDLEKDTTNVVLKSGGKVLGGRAASAQHIGFLFVSLQAQASKAKVIGLANAGGDTINAIKQASEFGLIKGGQKKLSPLLTFITDIDSIGLETAQGLILSEAFYWDLNDETRAFSKRFMERIKRVADFGAGRHLFIGRSLSQGSEKRRVRPTRPRVMKIMKDHADQRTCSPRTAGFAKTAAMVHEMYLFEVKKPSESKGRWGRLQAAGDGARQRSVPVAGTVALPAGEEITTRKHPMNDMVLQSPRQRSAHHHHEPARTGATRSIRT